MLKMNRFQVLLVVALCYISTAYTQEMCNLPAAIGNAVSCWLKNEDAQWLVDAEQLGMRGILENADWENFYKTLKETRNMTAAALTVLGDDPEGLLLGAALLADDAIYSEDDAVDYRNKLCGAIRALMKCGDSEGKQCSSKLEGYAKKKVNEQFGGTLEIPENVNLEQVMQMVDKEICFMCENDGEALKIVLLSMFDEKKRNKLQEFKEEEKRYKIYQECPIEIKSEFGSEVDSEYLIKLGKADPCNLSPYATCAATYIHKQINPDVELNVLGTVSNITFNDLFNCNTQVPASQDNCQPSF